MPEASTALITAEQGRFDAVCFYITPIGEDGSEYRKHSDLFLGSIVEPAIEPFKLKVIRADANTRIADLAKASPLKEYPAEMLRLMNNLYPHKEPQAGQLLKIVE